MLLFARPLSTERGAVAATEVHARAIASNEYTPNLTFGSIILARIEAVSVTVRYRGNQKSDGVICCSNFAMAPVRRLEPGANALALPSDIRA